MVFSEKIAEENWMEEQIENVLKSSNKELSSLKDLILSDEKNLKMDDKIITDDHITKVLKKSIIGKNNFNDIYSQNSAWIIFAVQHRLNKLWFTSVWNIDWLSWSNTNSAISAFQEKWNNGHLKDQIAVDGYAGLQTIKRLLVTNYSWETSVDIWKTNKSIYGFPWATTMEINYKKMPWLNKEKAFRDREESNLDVDLIEPKKISDVKEKTEVEKQLIKILGLQEINKTWIYHDQNNPNILYKFIDWKFYRNRLNNFEVNNKIYKNGHTSWSRYYEKNVKFPENFKDAITENRIKKILPSFNEINKKFWWKKSSIEHKRLLERGLNADIFYNDETVFHEYHWWTAAQSENDYMTIDNGGNLKKINDIGQGNTVFEIDGTWYIDDYRFDSVEAFFMRLQKELD